MFGLGTDSSSESEANFKCHPPILAEETQGDIQRRTGHGYIMQGRAPNLKRRTTKVLQGKECSVREQELDRLEANRITKKVARSEWAAPIVAVPKEIGKFIFVEIIRSPSIQAWMWISIPFLNLMIYLRP